jgi:hypothetical protein
MAFPRMNSCCDLAALYSITTGTLAACIPSIKDCACSAYHVGTSDCVTVGHFKSPDKLSNCEYWASDRPV